MLRKRSARDGNEKLDLTLKKLFYSSLSMFSSLFILEAIIFFIRNKKLDMTLKINYFKAVYSTFYSSL